MQEFIRGWGAAARPGNHFACRGIIQVWEGAEGEQLNGFKRPEKFRIN